MPRDIAALGYAVVANPNWNPSGGTMDHFLQSHEIVFAFWCYLRRSSSDLRGPDNKLGSNSLSINRSEIIDQIDCLIKAMAKILLPGDQIIFFSPGDALNEHEIQSANRIYDRTLTRRRSFSIT